MRLGLWLHLNLWSTNNLRQWRLWMIQPLPLTIMIAIGSDRLHRHHSTTSHPKNFVANVHLEDLLWRFLLIFFPNFQSQQHPSRATASAGPSLNFRTAVVLVLSVAAAAVFWKVKPEYNRLSCSLGFQPFFYLSQGTAQNLQSRD